ncbi:MAG TPA: thiamine-binding protein [Acidimicrobiales bacterium]|nr:thiamine-binding protein [Acidimicrobiales bacterium]
MIAAFSITPVGAGESVGELVAEAVRVVRESGLPCETNAMFTNVEGSWDEVMAVLKGCVERLSGSAPRLSVVVKLDVRPGAPGGQLTGKVERIGRLLSPVR